MVNKERLVELLGKDFSIGVEGDIFYDVEKKCIWLNKDLERINTLPQLLGVIADDLSNVEIYDKVFEEIDDSIFEIDFKKMTEILSSLGLRGGKDENGNFQIISCKATIHKNNFIHVIRKEPIYADSLVYSGEALYNDVLEASKNWNNEE